MKKFTFLLVFLLLGFYLSVSSKIPVSATTYYVNINATGANNGTNWINAYTSLQSALDAATSGGQIWIAKGIYKPSSAYGLGDKTSRYYHFEMKNGVAIYGGFDGTEDPATFDLGNRNFTTNQTILSGDFNDNDKIDLTGYFKITDNSDNCYHVFYHPASLALSSTAVLDGVTITGGNANGPSASYEEGGGMYNESCSPTLNNITFRKNVSSRNGGGMLNKTSSSPVITNTLFIENWASNGSGGGMSDDYSSPKLTNAIFCNNHASSGGGIYNFNSSAILTNVTICGNETYSGGSYGGGGIFNDGSLVTLALKNCIIYGNTTSTNNGNNFYLRHGGKITLEYCCYGNGSNDIGSDGNAYTFTPDGHCITSDPKFVDVKDGDCRLYGNSLCIDAGYDNYNTETADIRGAGYGRKLLKTDHTQAGTIDMGAYEYKEDADPMEDGFVIYVKPAEDGGNNSNDGKTWGTAVATLQKALDKAVSGKQIWIAKGTYKPSSAYSLTVAGDRDFHFEMKEGVEIYGGFAGTEDPKTFDLNNRDLTSNKTILSGDIGTEGDNSDDCYHVFYHPNGTGLTSAAVLDGVTISGGNANTIGIAPHMYGGGMYNYHCSPTLRNVFIIGNSADKGGGMYNDDSSSPTLFNVLISANSANYGGGMYNSNDNSLPSLNNVTISGNSCTIYGGGIYNNKSSTTLNNCIVWGNESASSGHELYNHEGSVNLNYSCYCNASGDVYGTVSPVNCTTQNPMFADAANGNYRLYGNSPCVDAGNNGYNLAKTDIRSLGFGRKLLKTDHTQEGTIDMGAYEYKEGSDPIIFYVRTSESGGSDGNNGMTWGTAFATLQKALNVVKSGDQIWIATGTYKPGTTRESYFSMKNGVKIYGGFAGTETLPGERTGYGMGGTSETILSGDIGTTGDNSDNCYHVFYHPNGTGLTSTAVLDGVTIIGGNANGTGAHANGGGIYNDHCSPALVNVFITGNSAVNGGGMYNNNSSGPTLVNVIFRINTASANGGGIIENSSSSILTNVTISGNSAAAGGGMYVSSSSPTLNNCIIWGNTSSSGGNEFYISSATVVLNSCCYGNKSGDMSGTVTPDANCITNDPLFLDATNGDYRITGISPCADAGNGSYNSKEYDIRGFGRKLLKTDPTQVGTIDIGAYEYKEGTDPVRLAKIIYVDNSATSGSNNGLSWGNAYTSLQSALTEAFNGDQIWIAAGTYKPGTTRDSYFSMKNGVKIYGGFARTETSVDDRTNFRAGGANETILSGDIGTPDDNSDNCYHVFCHPYPLVLNNTAILNGATITGGNADGSSYPDNSGAGIFNYYSSPTLINVTIRNNSAEFGGGIFNRETSSSPKLINVIITNNTASTGGGGMYTSGSPILTNVAITNNTATQGGGIYAYCSSPTLTNVTISGNTASNTEGEEGGEGGGIYYRCDASTYSMTLNNCIVWGNKATGDGNEFYLSNASAKCNVNLYYSCYANNAGDVDNKNGGFFTPDNHCITTDPNFADATNGDYRLYGDSPCKDTGNKDSNTETTDIRGQARIQNGAIDMGAYEWTTGLDPEPTIRFVNAGVIGSSNDGTSWANAYASLQDALTVAHAGDKVWIASGTYYPTKQVGGTGDRFATFQMKNGVEIYGGFAGTEDPVSFVLADRNFTTNKTILSGDIGTKNDNTDNCYHVFYHPDGLNLTSTAVLDGVTITKGYADVNGLQDTNNIDWHDSGGGMYNNGSSPTLVNIIICGNTVAYSGGGMYNSSSSPKLTNVLIDGNNSGEMGGGFTSLTFSPVLTNVTISSNTAKQGGGIYSYDGSLTLNNCVVWGNTASDGGNEFYLEGSSVALNYCCYGNNAGDIEKGNSTFTPDSHCINSDPNFADATNGDYRLYNISPCVDTGDNSANNETHDIRGADFGRKLLKTDHAQTGSIDMGAYEYKQGTDPEITVALSVSSASINENAVGSVTVTATRSAASNQMSTVLLSFSGTATEGADYTTSSATISIPAGSTSGSIIITPVNDTDYEENETVIIDILSVTNGTEAGVQSQTVTLVNDDNQPTVTLGLTGSPFLENGGTATVTATLSNKSFQNVTVYLSFSGTAVGSDYTTSSSSITINAGSTSGSITLTGIDDTDGEGDEKVIVAISSVANGSEKSEQEVTATIADDDAPIVSLVSATTANGSYKASSEIDITISFSYAVNVTGTPQLTLETGTTDHVANYVSGSGTTTLTFKYTIQDGDESTDLDYASQDALSLNGGTISTNGVEAILTLAAPGETGSLGKNKAIMIDTTTPTVSSINSSTANGSYKAGDVISIQVNFSEAVTVTGTPQLTLETGTTDQVINYASGSGTNTLTFTYSVQAGDTSSDLDYQSTTAFALNGGTINDEAGNNATLTLAIPGAENSLGKNKAIVIDTTTPTVSSINSSTANGSYKAGDVISIQVNFSEAVTVTGTPQLTLETGTTDQVINYASGSGTNTLTFTYSVQAGDTSSDLDYQSSTAFALNGGTINDEAGNNATLTLAIPGAENSLGNNKAIVIDTTTPTVSSINSSTANGTYKLGDVIVITITFTEAVAVTGTPTLDLNSGGTVSFTSGSGTTALTFSYIVGSSESSADLDYSATNSLALAGGTIKDAAGNDAILTLPTVGGASSLGGQKDILIAINPSSGGTIATNQAGCYPFSPNEITSSVLPSGHVGTLEYKWQSSTTSNIAGFSDIAGSNSTTYNPGSLTVNTWYKRLARVNCMCDWTGAVESNVVKMTVYDLLLKPTAGSNSYIYDGTEKTAVANVGAGETVDWYAAATGITTASAPTGTNVNTYSAYAETRNTTTNCVSANRTLITLEIKKMDISGTFTASDKIYDGNNSATVTGRSLVGVLAADAANVSLTGGTATFSDEQGETGKTVTSSGMALIGTAAPNYNLTGVATTTADITKAMLIVTAEAKTKVYGEANPALTFLYSGWKNSDSETILDTKPAASTTVDLLTPVGTHTNTITVSGGVDNNYDFTYIPANFNVSRAMLTITAEAKTKVYGEANPALTFLYSGWKNSDSEIILDTKPAASTTVDLLTPVGTHPIMVSSGMDNNYDFTYVPADFEVTKALLTIDAEAQDKVYDGNTSASVTGAKLVGVLNGDVVSLTLGSASFENKNVGNDKGITVTGSSIFGAGAGNYTLKEISGLKANITPKQLTITNTSVVSNKMFDNATTATVENVGTLQGVETDDGNLVDVSAIANYNDAAIGNDKVITTVFTIDGSAASNYIKPSDLIITGAKISDKINMAETMEVPVTGECQGEDLSVGYNILSGTPTEYQITFDAGALAAGFVNTGYLPLTSTQNQDRLYIHVPVNMVEGVYTANLQFRNELNNESPVYPFEFTIKLSKDYIVKKFDDVILCDNSLNKFTAFQWYKNGLPIPGATGQFYNEESGLDGLYSLQVSTKEGVVLWSCEQEIHAANFKNATISAYPNPARSTEPFTVKVTNLNDQDLRGAVMRIYNVLGALVQTINEVKQINSVTLPFGEYIGTVITSDQKRFIYKITVVNL